MPKKSIKQSAKWHATKYPLAKRHSSEKKGMGKGVSKERQLFLQLLRNYPDGAVSIVDKNYNFIVTGGELHERLAAEPLELIGHKIYPKFPEKMREIIKAQLKKIFQGNVLSKFELPYPLKGELYIMDAFPLKEEDGSIIYAGVIIRNISHLKIANAEVNRSLKKEKEFSELKSRFLTMASHEFRTPLSSVLLSADLLKKYVPAGQQENLDRHINRIVSSVHLLNELLNDFLSVEEIERGKVAVNPVIVPIKEHIAMLINEIANTQKKSNQISYLHTGEEQVFLDPVLLKHIIQNLLSNAIKFSAENSPVEVNTEWINQRFVLSVKDYGIGIPQEYRKHLFERFYRASNALNIQGTGLGLHLVSKYVALMNGTRSCNSYCTDQNKYRGCFKIYLS